MIYTEERERVAGENGREAETDGGRIEGATIHFGGKVDGHGDGWAGKGGREDVRGAEGCAALTVSPQVVLLGNEPAAGGEPIQSAEMESKVTVHSYEIATADRLSMRQWTKRNYTHTPTH